MQGQAHRSIVSQAAVGAVVICTLVLQGLVTATGFASSVAATELRCAPGESRPEPRDDTHAHDSCLCCIAGCMSGGLALSAAASGSLGPSRHGEAITFQRASAASHARTPRLGFSARAPPQAGA